MNVLSLFDGMSCGQIALKKLGIIPGIYYASEIDKHAIGQTQLNFPNTIQLGSVTEVDVAKLERIDLLIGGSPCQSFSFAGKRKGMSTKCEIDILSLDQYLQLKEEGFEFEGQSYLFWEYMRILTDIRKYNPDVLFLLENVEMGAKWERVLSQAIGVFGVHLNSALVSAQVRKRIYWTNIRTHKVGLFDEVHSAIPQPKDRGILLRDILESEVDEKYYLSDSAINRALRKEYSSPQINPDKTGTLNTKNNSGQCSFDSGSTFISINGKAPTQRKSNGRSFDKKHNYQFIKVDKQLNPKSDQDKASCFTAGAHSGGNHSDMDLIVVNQKRRRVMQLNEVAEFGQQPRQQNRIYDTNGISPALMANMSCGTHAIAIPEATEKGFVEILPGECFDFENPTSKTRRGRKMEDKSNCLMTGKTSFMHYTPKQRIRRLTPTECARLQTVPTWYQWKTSDTQQYRMLGNGWTVDIITHIFSFLPEEFKTQT